MNNNLKNSQIKITTAGRSYILYDASAITKPVSALFTRDYHTNQQTQQSTQQSSGIGRAPVVYFSQGSKPYVLKHYYRGGAVALVLKDYYLGFSVIKSRAFKEFRLLKKMHALGLPVPVAVAAHVKKGLLFYQADLITEEIVEEIGHEKRGQAKTLADVLTNKPLDSDMWQKIGACIKQFHHHNIYHADLNARNILLTHDSLGRNKVHLIDFDNSYIRLSKGSAKDAWKAANLSRLKRSLLKFKKNTPGFHFDEADWHALLVGY